VSILYLYSYLKDNPHLFILSTKKDMGCVIPHQSNAVNISHQTNAGLRKQKSYSHNREENNSCFPTEIITFVFIN